MKTTKKFTELIGDKLYSCREEKGMTTKEFSSYLGIPYRNYMNYESGYFEPTLKTLVSICNKLEISIDSMIGR